MRRIFKTIIPLTFCGLMLAPLLPAREKNKAEPKVNKIEASRWNSERTYSYEMSLGLGYLSPAYVGLLMGHFSFDIFTNPKWGFGIHSVLALGLSGDPGYSPAR